MARLTVVSNRPPGPERSVGAGGFVPALEAALAARGGLWFGWSRPAAPGPVPSISRADGFKIATIGLSESEIEGCHDTLSNRTLWPALHSRLDLAKIDHLSYATYRSVNRRLAASLRRLLRADDTVWVHDYHVIPLGHELRRLGVRAPIGFFLHTPFPAAEVFASLPWAQDLARLLSAYDLLGFQTRRDAENFRAYVCRHAVGTVGPAGWRLADGRCVRIEAHPMGIDAGRQAALAASPSVAARAAHIRRCLEGRLGIAGVDGLDHSQGLTQRFRTFEHLLERDPHYIDRITLCQIAAPSRQPLPEHRALEARLAAESGRINARFDTLGWMPIRYLSRRVEPAQVAALMRASRVGLMTPLRDGMNLTAKEYVAAQDPTDPGVLVLSRFAGAAEQLTGALIVNPYDTGETAQALRTALEMPASERIARWRALMREVETHDVHDWARDYLHALAAAHADRRAYAPSAA